MTKINCNLSILLDTNVSMFHFLCIMLWFWTILGTETYTFYVSFLLSMFHFWGITLREQNIMQENQNLNARKSKPQCKKIKNTMQEISEHNARDAEWRNEMKSETLCFKFHSLKLLIINRLCLVSETWKMKSHWP